MAAIATMQVPAGFEARQEGTGLFARRGSESFGVLPMQRKVWNATRELLAANPKVTLEEVEYGIAKGYRVTVGGETKSFMLRLQGKHVMVSVSCPAGPLERCLPSLCFAAAPGA